MIEKIGNYYKVNEIYFINYRLAKFYLKNLKIRNNESKNQKSRVYCD